MFRFCTLCRETRGGKFCGFCGSKLISNPFIRRCPRCRLPLVSPLRLLADLRALSEDNFCFQCGWDLREAFHTRNPFRLAWQRLREWATTGW